MDTANKENLELRCYAERENDGSWFAICLDLNLYARADSAKDARTKLNEIIDDYVKEAFTVDLAFVHQLIPRRAPTYFWLRYYRIALAIKVIKIFNRRKQDNDGNNSFLFHDRHVHA